MDTTTSRVVAITISLSTSFLIFTGVTSIAELAAASNAHARQIRSAGLDDSAVTKR